jgi:DNA modification methylase
VPHYQDDDVTVWHGDCIAVLAELAEASVDAVVTDPPYGLEFMGKEWDSFKVDRKQPGDDGYTNGPGPYGRAKVRYGSALSYGGDNLGAMVQFQLWCTQWATECLRVLKPGGHLVAFGGTRTWHRLAVAIEDAGFEIRDNLAWIFGSGFPKGSRVNRDERFCQCAASAHTNSHTSHGTQPDDRTRTEGAAGEAVYVPRSVPRETPSAPSSRAGCRPEHGSDDGPLLLVPVGGQACAPSPGCAPVHNHFGERADDLSDESSRNPSLAPCTGHPSSRDYSHRARSQNDAPAHTRENMSPADISESDCRTPDNHQGSSQDYATGFPRCMICGKPNADGWNVALKPAFEPIILARKPIRGTVAANVCEHGTGALNIDGCRVGADEQILCHGNKGKKDVYGDRETTYGQGDGREYRTGGRWPPNVLLDGEMAAELDRQSGTGGSGSGQQKISSGRKSGDGSWNRDDHGLFDAGRENTGIRDFGDSGGASRFFPVFKYTAKAPGSERPTANGISHATVKPLELMRWLVRLVTPPHGLVLDPFAGSGTTAEACIHEHMRAIVIEREADYLPLIVARLSKPMAVGFDFEEGA